MMSFLLFHMGWVNSIPHDCTYFVLICKKKHKTLKQNKFLCFVHKMFRKNLDFLFRLSNVIFLLIRVKDSQWALPLQNVLHLSGKVFQRKGFTQEMKGVVPPDFISEDIFCIS